MSFYRFLKNKRVRLTEVIENEIARSQLATVSGDVLAVSDTSSVNLQSHAGRLNEEGLGYIGGGPGKHLGFHLHPTICLAAENSHILGLSSIQMWVREEVGKERKAIYKRLPFEAKESYKWVRAAEETKAALPNARQLTMMGDREADCYEEMVLVPDARTHLLLRSCQNRRLADGGYLNERLAEQAVSGEYELLIAADGRVNREARRAQIEVRFTEVLDCGPGYLSG